MTARAKRVRVGMIGAGYIAGYHLDGLRATGGADVRAIAGRTPDRSLRSPRGMGSP
ncbi:MAG: hypothetical protein IPI73_05465 [Betaproteobacteria bacterium]|nr:hypothetical protein [Betaproteobacteria bacterium]